MIFILNIFYWIMTNLPIIQLKTNEWTQLSDVHFKNAADGISSKQKTEVKLLADESYLRVDFKCLDNPFTHQNSYNQHNSEMYHQEVFELFISEGSETPTRYLELEINPNNALFIGFIDNPTKEAPEKCQFVSHDESKILHQVEKKSDSWAGSLQIPWKLLGGKKSQYRINFYRIISLKSHPDTHWKGTPASCAYLCWNSTMSGKTPRFHRPEKFGFLQID